jgi:hypothetical protein
LPGWVSAIVVIALGWRGLQNLGKIRELPKWMLIPLVLFGGIGVFAEYWTIVGRDAGLALLTVMTSFKFLESKRHRDMLILVFLCYFLIATHFLYSQSVFTAAMMFVNLIVITATLITLNQRDDSVSLWERVRGSSKLVGLSVPLMLILFVLVPRVPGPLWGLQSEQRGGVTGLSNHMSPGKISNLIRSNEVAFRVDFKDQVPAQNRLYWRGPVMAQYDGYTWTQIPRKPLNRLNITVSEPAIDYTVTLEPNGERWLLALDMPIRLIKGSAAGIQGRSRRVARLPGDHARPPRGIQPANHSLRQVAGATIRQSAGHRQRGLENVSPTGVRLYLEPAGAGTRLRR